MICGEFRGVSSPELVPPDPNEPAAEIASEHKDADVVNGLSTSRLYIVALSVLPEQLP